MSHALNSKRPADRRPLLWAAAVVALVVLLLLIVPWLRETLSSTTPDYWPTTAWRSSTPEAQGLDSDVLAASIARWHAQGLPIHSLTIVRNGYVVTDATFYPYDGQTVHDVASVTKSVMTTLIGIAADQGKLDLDDPMVSFFPEYTIANMDARKQAITVRDLASMSSGLRCTRDGFPNATAQEMHASDDFVQFVLDLPMAAQPGGTFVYCSPAIHLLSPILQKATGMTPLAFAQQYLFAPLGIQEATWEQDPQGYYNGWGDLALKPGDMAKIGLLFLQGGRWEKEQVVSRGWVEAATKMQMAAPNEDAYGYGWWITDDPVPVFRADGRQGQYIIGLPEWQLLVVTTGGGGDGEGLIDWALSAYEHFGDTLPPALFVLGPFMEPSRQEEFLARAAYLPEAAAMVFDAEMERIVDRAAGVVAMGGYNTFCEILSFDKPAVIVPREKPRREQWIRARQAAELGLTRLLEDPAEHGGARDPAAMAAAISGRESQPRPSAALRPGMMDGLDEVVRLAARLLP